MKAQTRAAAALRPLPVSAWQPSICLLSIYLLWTFHIIGSTQYVTFCVSAYIFQPTVLRLNLHKVHTYLLADLVHRVFFCVYFFHQLHLFTVTPSGGHIVTSFCRWGLRSGRPSDLPEVAQLLGSRQDVSVGGFAPEFMLLTAAVHGLSGLLHTCAVRELAFPRTTVCNTQKSGYRIFYCLYHNWIKPTLICRMVLFCFQSCIILKGTVKTTKILK